MLTMTYLELREAAADLCPIPAAHRAEVEATGACTYCGWFAGMSLTNQQAMVDRKIDRFLATA